MNKTKAIIVCAIIATMFIIGSASAVTYFGNTLSIGPTVVSLNSFSPLLTTNYSAGTATPTVPITFTVTLKNPSTSSPSPSNVLICFNITKTTPVISNTDITLEYAVGTVWTPIPIAWESTYLLTGTFGPTIGFPVTSGYDQTTQLRITYNVAGTYSGTIQTRSVT